MKLKCNKLKVSCETNNKQEVIKYYRNRQDTKYRELSIILVLSTLLAVGVSINEYKSNAVSSNQYKSSIHFIEKISNDLNIDKTHIYI